VLLLSALEYIDWAASSCGTIFLVGEGEGVKSICHILVNSSFVVSIWSFSLAGGAVGQCFSTFVRPRPGKLVFYKTRARGPTNLLINTFPIFFKFIH
jgi:hypothetical protein